MEFRTLRLEELETWAAHCDYVFTGEGHPVDQSYFLRHFLDDPWRDLNGIFVAVDDGRIAATVRVFRRQVWLFGRAVPMGGIGEVSTHPAYRGRGLAGTLLNMAVDWMVREGMAVSALYSGLHDFYRRYGWEIIPKPDARFAVPDCKPCAGRLMEPGDLPTLRVVDRASDRSNWRVVRDGAEYWEKWMKSAIGKCAVAIDGGSVVAWLAYETGEEHWTVQDFRALPGYEDKFAGLCRLVAGAEGRADQPFIAPPWLAGGLLPTDKMALNYCMVRLNIPFAADDITINTTQDLIAATGEYRDSTLDHF